MLPVPGSPYQREQFLTWGVKAQNRARCGVNQTQSPAEGRSYHKNNEPTESPQGKGWTRVFRSKTQVIPRCKTCPKVTPSSAGRTTDLVRDKGQRYDQCSRVSRVDP